MRLIQGLLLFVCACVPGCGQMKQGYMKRGISQTIAFSAVLAVAIALQVGVLAVFLAPLWLYSFFDAYNLRRLRLEGAGPEDAYLFGLSDLDTRRLNGLINRRHSLIGWGLVLLGLYSLWMSMSSVTYSLLSDLLGFNGWWLFDTLRRGVPRMVATLLVIALGIWFIRGPRKRDSVPDFTPPKELDKGPGRTEAIEEGEEEFPHGADC